MPSFIRSIENELDKNVLQFEIEGYQCSMNKPSWISFGEKYPTNLSHRHNVYEICICLSGQGFFRCNSTEYKINKHTIFAGPPLIPHEIYVEPGKTMQLMYFVASFSKLRAVKESSFIDAFILNPKICVNNVPEPALYSPLFKGRAMNSSSTEWLLKAWLVDCLTALGAENTAKTDVEKAVAYIDSNSHRNFSVAELANSLSMSERGLYYFFKESFDMSPKDFINKRKMSAALEYLRMGLAPGHVCDLLKFSDLSSFCRMFKKYYGISPSKASILREGLK